MQRSGAAGTPDFRLFEVGPNGVLTLRNLHLRNGRASNGGALFNNFGQVVLEGSEVSASVATCAWSRGSVIAGLLHSMTARGMPLTKRTRSGMMVAPLVFLEPNMMGFVLIYAFAGALLGGIDNPWGAVIGGFAMGVLENIMGVYVVGTELKLTVALVIIVGVLVIKPSGVFGKAVLTRV